MSYTCFHCEHETDQVHYVTLNMEVQEQNELLCDECYFEWLASLKG